MGGGNKVARHSDFFKITLALPETGSLRAQQFLDEKQVQFQVMVNEPCPMLPGQELTEFLVLYAASPAQLKERLTLLSAAGFDEPQVERFRWDPGAWVEKWKEYYQWVKISPRLAVGPAFKPCPFDVEHLVRIEPGQSFGTGNHESTRIALKFIDRYLAAGSSICDAGCGSGVLSIAALKLGARNALAFDFDAESCRDCLLNCANNDVNPLVLRSGTAPVAARFDVVAANILGHILVTIASPLRNMVRPGGVLILSGLTDKDDEAFLAGFFKTEGEFEMLERAGLNDWWGGAWRKRT